MQFPGPVANILTPCETISITRKRSQYLLKKLNCNLSKKITTPSSKIISTPPKKSQLDPPKISQPLPKYQSSIFRKHLNPPPPPLRPRNNLNCL